MKTYLLCVLMITACFFSTSSSLAGGEKLKITGIYSNMHYNAEGGDVLGIELLLLFSRDGYYIIYQSSEGEPTIPVIVKPEISNNYIRFTIPEGFGYTGIFEGEITTSSIIGKFLGGKEVKLKRGNSYWQ